MFTFLSHFFCVSPAAPETKHIPYAGRGTSPPTPHQKMIVPRIFFLEVLHDGAIRVSGGFFCLSLVGRPQGEVVTQQLHDEGGVFVGLLGERVELRDGVVESLWWKYEGWVREH